MGNVMITRSFLIYLWRKELILLAGVICLAILAAVRIVFRSQLSYSALEHENAVNISERLKELTEQR